MRGLAIGAALAALASAAPTFASRASLNATATGCGGVEQASALHRGGSLPPLAIGDSTMLLALPDLTREGFDVNARGCRQYPEALALISELARSGRLPHLVAIALGANGQIEPSNIEQALRILGPSRVLVLLTPRELGGGSGSDAQLVRSEGRQDGERLVVLDWVAYSAEHPGWFEADGLHVNPTGAAGLASLLGSVLPIAAPPTHVQTPSCPPPPNPTSVQAPTAGATSPTPSASTTPGLSVPHGVALRYHDGVLLVDARSRRLELPITDDGTSTLAGLARVELLGTARHTVIAAACVAVAAEPSSHVSIRLTPETVADAELLARFRIRVSLELTTPEGLKATATRTYVLRGAVHS